MYDHHIRDMATLVVGKSQEDAYKALKEYWRERIAVSWSVDDVIGRAEDRDISITEEQALDVLNSLEHNHDCNEGINWLVIDCHIDFLLEKA
jgi:hypothetical protein